MCFKLNFVIDCYVVIGDQNASLFWWLKLYYFIMQKEKWKLTLWKIFQKTFLTRLLNSDLFFNKEKQRWYS